MGRLWHTLILSKWNPLFAGLPVESMIDRNQEAYYRAINNCNDVADSTEFIRFMLDVIKKTLSEAMDAAEQVGTSPEQVRNKSGEKPGQVDAEALLAFCRVPKSRAEMQEFCGVGGRKRFYTQCLLPLLESGRLAMTIPEKPNSSRQRYVATGK